jgi:hypothetical protein
MSASLGIRRAALPALVAVVSAAGVGAGIVAGWRAAGVPAPVAAMTGRPPSPPAAASAAAAATWIDLGRNVCGECCETLIWRAVGNLRGVRDVTARVGESTIVVHHDGNPGLPASMLCALGEAWPEATLAAGRADAPQARQWIRPVQRGR